MATRKTASKVSKKAELNLEFDKPKKSQQNKAKRTLKKLSPVTFFVAVLFLAIGAAGGWFGVKFLTKNDCFILNGKDEITLTVGAKYIDEGANVIEFGKDIAAKVSVETNMDKNQDGSYTSNEVGTFYMVYTVDSIKYGTIFKVQKIRLVTFVEESEEEEHNSAQTVEVLYE